MVGGILVDHGPVPGELQGHALLGRTPDLEALLDDTHPLPALCVPVSVPIPCVRLVNVDVLLIGSEDRQPERDDAVVPDRYTRESRLACTDHIQTRCAEVHD